VRVVCDYCGKKISKSPNQVMEHNFCNQKHYHAYCKEHPEMYKNRNCHKDYTLFKLLKAKANGGEKIVLGYVLICADESALPKIKTKVSEINPLFGEWDFLLKIEAENYEVIEQITNLIDNMNDVFKTKLLVGLLCKSE